MFYFFQLSKWRSGLRDMSSSLPLSPAKVDPHLRLQIWKDVSVSGDSLGSANATGRLWPGPKKDARGICQLGGSSCLLKGRPKGVPTLGESP